MEDQEYKEIAENAEAEAVFEDMADEGPDEADEYDLKEFWDEGTRKRGPRLFGDFLRGTIFGLLLAGVFVLSVVLVRHGTLGGNAEGAGVLTSQNTQEKLMEIRSLVEQTFLYDVDPKLLEDWMFKGIAIGLDDAYATYFSAEELEALEEENEGTYYGIGIVMGPSTENDDMTILSVYDESPAMKAGLLGGDIILEVNGTSIAGMDVQSVSDLIGSSPDEKVDITVLREKEKLTFTVLFDQISMAPVRCEMVTDTIGCITLPRFNLSAVDEFHSGVEELKEQGMEKLIVDVRDNPGGILYSVTSILDDLLPEGVIVSTRSKEGKKDEIRSDDERIFDGPVAVLVNKNSASASEVFAGAVQDYHLGPVVGETTYGKGVVQRTYSLRDGSAFKLTTEKYFTPLGQDIDGTGITPDIVTDDGAQMQVCITALEE